MQDIRNKSDDEIKAAIAGLVPDVGAANIHVVRADRFNRTSRVVAIRICDVGYACDNGASGPLTFMTLSQLAGVCMTPDISIGPELTVSDGSPAATMHIVVGWHTPLVTSVG